MKKEKEKKNEKINRKIKIKESKGGTTTSWHAKNNCYKIWVGRYKRK